jgi:hypothetical protein
MQINPDRLVLSLLRLFAAMVFDDLYTDVRDG